MVKHKDTRIKEWRERNADSAASDFKFTASLNVLSALISKLNTVSNSRSAVYVGSGYNKNSAEAKLCELYALLGGDDGLAAQFAGMMGRPVEWRKFEPIVFDSAAARNPADKNNIADILIHNEAAGYILKYLPLYTFRACEELAAKCGTEEETDILDEFRARNRVLTACAERTLEVAGEICNIERSAPIEDMPTLRETERVYNLMITQVQRQGIEESAYLKTAELALRTLNTADRLEAFSKSKLPTTLESVVPECMNALSKTWFAVRHGKDFKEEVSQEFLMMAGKPIVNPINKDERDFGGKIY